MSRLRDGYLTTNKYYGVLIAYTVPVRESVMNVLQALDGSEQESYRTVLDKDFRYNSSVGPLQLP